LLGLALERDGKLPKAVDELTQAVNLRPEDVEAALDLIRVQRAAGNAKDARARMDQLAQRRGLPAEARRRLATYYERDNLPDRAIALLTASSSGGGTAQTTRPTTAPVDPASTGRLARLYWRVGNLTEAESLFVRLVDEPAAPAADLVAAADFFAARGQGERAGAALGRLAKLTLKPPALDLLLARFAERFPGTAAAVAGDPAVHYAAATSAAPTNPEAWRELAGFHLRHGRTAEAADAVEKGIKAAGADPALAALRQRVALVKTLKRPDDARPLIDLIAREPTNDAAAEMLQVVADAQATTPSPAASAKAAARLREIADRHPDFLPAQLQLIHYYLATSRPDDAAALAARAAQAFPAEPEPTRLLAEAYRQGNQPNKWAKVMEAASQWRERSAADPLAPDLALAEAQLAQSQPQAAAQRLTPYVKGPPATQPASPGDGGGGETVLADRDAALYRVYCRALISAGRAGEAAALLEPLLPSVGDARLIWLGLATAHGDADSATAWLGRAAPHLAKDSVIEQGALAEQWHAVGKRFGSQSALERSRDVLQPLVARPDAGAELWDLQGRNALELGDYDTAVSAWRKVVALSGARPTLSNNLAYVLLVRGNKADLEEARKLAESAVGASPDESTCHDTLARVYARLGEHDKSVASFRTAIAKDSGNVEAMIGLADELAHGDKKAEAAEAKDLLGKINRAVTKGPPLSTPTRKQLEGLRAALDLGDGTR
jgi:tetratricopeptide (TPR) repeat protein